jgi:ABC-2 type transport system ATP-binding protein
MVAGLDVVRQAEELRHVIGLAGQNAAVDENLTGLENLEMVGRLYHVPSAEAKRRGEEILERFELSDAAHRVAKTYSGGMRRRLDLGASLVGKPRVLFLDEPTTGLDPRGRLEMWEVIRGLVMEGTTLLLTTQYLDEADRLANKIAVIDVGRVIAEGTSDELKARVGGEMLALRVAERDRAGEAAGTVLGLGPGGGSVDNDTGEINIPVGTDGTGILTEAVRRLDAEGIKLADIGLRRPTLDDVFLSLTGHAAEEADAEQQSEDGRRPRRRERKRERV